MCDSLRPHGLYPTRLLRPWNFPGKSTEVGCHFLLQGIFPTQGLNPGLPHCRQTFLPSEPPYFIQFQLKTRKLQLRINNLSKNTQFRNHRSRVLLHALNPCYFSCLLVYQTILVLFIIVVCFLARQHVSWDLNSPTRD